MILGKKSKPRLKKTLYSLLLPDGQILILFSPAEQIILPELSTMQKELLIMLDGSSTVEEITGALNRKKLACTVDDVLSVLNAFTEHFLLEDLSCSEHEEFFPGSYKEKFARQLAFFGVYSQTGRHDALAFQKKLQQMHVALIGAGGFGSDIFYNLISMGFGKITTVEFDKVERSNLNRQSMYSDADIGKYKIDVLKEKTKAVDSSEFRFINKKISAASDIAEIIGEAHIGIIAADSPREKIFHWMNEACYETGVPGLFTSGATPVCVIIGPLVIPGKTSCYACSMPDVPFRYNDPLVQSINGSVELGVISPYVRVAAGLMSLELLKHVTKFVPCQLYDQTIKLNLLNYSVNIYKNNSRPGCRFCHIGTKKGENF